MVRPEEALTQPKPARPPRLLCQDQPQQSSCHSPLHACHDGSGPRAGEGGGGGGGGGRGLQRFHLTVNSVGTRQLDPLGPSHGGGREVPLHCPRVCPLSGLPTGIFVTHSCEGKAPVVW